MNFNKLNKLKIKLNKLLIEMGEEGSSGSLAVGNDDDDDKILQIYFT